MSGYMAACWRALAKREDLEVTLFVAPWRPHWEESITEGFPDYHRLDDNEASDATVLAKMVKASNPDVVIVSGWALKGFRGLIGHRELDSCRFILAMDTPWQGRLKQLIAPLFLRRLLQKCELVVVAGERTWRYAKYILGNDVNLRRGTYGFDFDSFNKAVEARRVESAKWPRRFLFTGRLVKEKNISLMLEAYAQYRDSVESPWSLTICGTGPEEALCQNRAGVHLAGFVQPSDLLAVMANHGAFILPSSFEPWGVVIAEAAAAGLPVVCSEACGAGLDIVRNYYNGVVIPGNDVGSLADAMCWIHFNESKVPTMGGHSVELARAFSAQAWAMRVGEYCKQALLQK
jgi:glycosyltransferase involved in cell wall biosynthesis